MKVMEFLNSGLLPRQEKTPDVFSRESYWALPDNVSLYSHGFNHTTYEKQSKPIIQNLQDMTPEKFDLLQKFKDYEVAQVVTFTYTGDHNYCVAVHIQIDISNEELKKMGLLK